MSSASQVAVKGGYDELERARLERLYKEIKSTMDKLQADSEEFNATIKGTRDTNLKKLTEFALALKMGKLDEDALNGFFSKPYPDLMPYRDHRDRVVPDTYLLMMPRLVPMQVGFLVKQDASYNYFRVNRFMDWFGEIPDFIKSQVKWKDAPELVLVGDSLVGSPEALAEAKVKYAQFIKGEEEGKLKVDRSRAYELIVELLRQGVKPFSKQPVKEEDRIEGRLDFVLRDYQKEIVQALLDYSTIGVFIPPSTGKTVIGLWGLTHIKGPHIVVCPTKTLVEQWTERIQAHTDLKIDTDVIVTTYWGAIKKYGHMRFKLKVYDEVHHLPAEQFIKLSMIPSDYTLGLSATPYREDEGGEELIFALTGQPTGLSWQYFRDLEIISSPTCRIWVERTKEEKMRRLETLLANPMKTIIFSDSLDLGAEVAKKYGLPFVSGVSTERLKTLGENQTTVISRVGDEGVSLPDIKRVIEISGLFGSRRQELQRFTRLLHAQGSTGVAEVLMTIPEYEQNKKRFFSIMDRGFKVQLILEGEEKATVEGSSISTPRSRAAAPRAPRPAANRPPKEDVTIGEGATDAFLKMVPKDIALMPGIVRRMGTMPKGDRAAFAVMSSKDGEWWSKAALIRALGLANDHHIRLSKMVEDKDIERKMEKGSVYFRTNVRGIRN